MSDGSAQDPDRTPSARLSEYVVTESIEDVPERVVERVKYLVLDCLGVTLGGTTFEESARIRGFLAGQRGVAEATVPGLDEKLPPMQAAYANGYLGNVLDYDDTYTNRAIGHPGVTTIPPALAAAEKSGASGRSFLEAVIVGYETALRIGDAIAPSPERDVGFFSGVWQIFGAAAATSKLLGSDPATVQNAFALAGTIAPVPATAIKNGDVQSLKSDYGWVAMGGMKSSFLAERGFGWRGRQPVFEGDPGFPAIAGSDRFDPDRLTDGLGIEYLLSNVSFKPYPSCRWVHPALDCVETLGETADPGDVETITVETFREAAQLDGYPETPLEAQFSLPFCIAVSLSGYEPGVAWLSEDRIDDPDIRSLADTVTVETDPERAARYDAEKAMSAAVAVERDDRSVHRAETRHPSGSPENPLSDAAIEGKFTALATGAIGRDAAREVMERILSIEDEPGVGAICDLL